MTQANKKNYMYVGGAIVLGSVSFFVYSFFKKPTTIGNTSISMLDEPKDSTPSKDWTKFFSDLGNDFVPNTKPFQTMGFDAKLWNSVK